MVSKFRKIWELALPYLRKAARKDFVLHTEGVIHAMDLLLKEERGDESILMPAAILHDVGWADVPKQLQKAKSAKEKKKSMELHIAYAPNIIREILSQVDYDMKKTERIIEVVVSHKFQDPKEKDKQLLIDADTLAEAFKEQFYSDAEAYGCTPKENYEYRIHNKFYTGSAKRIFSEEMKKRIAEIEGKK